MTIPPRSPNKPSALPDIRVARALEGSEPLVGLLKRLHESRRRFDAIADLLPEPLRETVRPGPLDDSAWFLLASHAAAAAKVRQMLPALQARLLASGWPSPEIKVRVSSTAPGTAAPRNKARRR